MAYLWMVREVERAAIGEWTAVPLDDEDAYPLVGADGQGAAVLLRSRDGHNDLWLIMAIAPTGVCVNGAPLRCGIHALAHGDEVRIAGLGRVFYSSETLATITPLPTFDAPAYCLRCNEPLAAGTSGVRCPGCQRWYHQNDTLRCFTYADRCVLCPQRTALDAALQWSPAGI